MREIPLTRGYVALVDGEDYGRVSSVRWNAQVRQQSDGTVHVYARRIDQGRPVYMHRFIVGAERGVQVDHVNGNPLDNTRVNLRVANARQNAQNCRKIGGTACRFKGVQRRRNRWQAKIRANGKQVYLGCFGSDVEAARAYDAAARTLHGGFARTNASLGLL